MSKGKPDRNVTVRRRDNLEIIFNYTTIIPFKWRNNWMCFYCGDMLPLYTQLKEHTLSHGQCKTTCYALRKVKGNDIEVKIDVSNMTCLLCSNGFKSFDVILQHLIEVHQLQYDLKIDMPLQRFRLVDNQCSYCEEQLPSYKLLVAHVTKQHPQLTYICNYCGEKFTKKTNIASHIRNIHCDNSYSCELCHKKFDTIFRLKKHRSLAHQTQCHVCGANFLNQRKLRIHLQSNHPNDDTKQCNQCSRTFHSTIGLKMHLAKCHIVPKCNGTNQDESQHLRRESSLLTKIRLNIKCVLNMSTAMPFKFKAKFVCFYCSQKFIDFDDLVHHSRSNHPVCELDMKAMKGCKGHKTRIKIDINNLSCKLCGDAMENLNLFVDHAMEAHQAVYFKTLDLFTCFEPYRIIKDNIPCPHCTKTFQYYNTLLRHIHTEHTNKDEICDYCGRGFRNQDSLNVHVKMNHTGWCECKTCHIKFKNNMALARHMAKHHNVKKFKCSDCSEMFESRYQRQKHLIQVHNTGIKCEYCGKLFTKHSFMKSHVRRTHLKEKTEPCSVCNMKFFDKYMLKMHMVKHDGERKFRCDICGSAFLRQRNLRTHMDTHKKYADLR